MAGKWQKGRNGGKWQKGQKWRENGRKDRNGGILDTLDFRHRAAGEGTTIWREMTGDVRGQLSDGGGDDDEREGRATSFTLDEVERRMWRGKSDSLHPRIWINCKEELTMQTELWTSIPSGGCGMIVGLRYIRGRG
eukprot:TRINITY_DN1717_c0_g1_i1.p1 TRINITY_DN1717_c0_g1~~TRINITY_DN1717_c0_g1_i1.p1  ORF type:complete len:136 (-),score=11.81 TRINITY_DN1717_c0_g1_i1:95-502(-)